jgi:hypothetical protein
MGVAKWKLRDGAEGTNYYIWDGDYTHEPELLTGGIGSTLNSITGPTLVTLGTNEVANLITYCRAAAVAREVAKADAIHANTGAKNSIQALLDDFTFTVT